MVLFQFVFYIALLFIFTSFTANIVALLQSTTKSIRSISDLQNPAIGVGVHDTPFNRYYFAVQTEPSRKLLYETKVAPPNDGYMNLSYGISRMREGMFAFHVSTGQGYDEVERTFFENEKCGLVEIPFLGPVDTWTVIQKQSPYREILKVKWVVSTMLLINISNRRGYSLFQHHENSGAWHSDEGKRKNLQNAPKMWLRRQEFWKRSAHWLLCSSADFCVWMLCGAIDFRRRETRQTQN